jgi:glycosyltransferase involved in cell wall biosynthesis
MISAAILTKNEEENIKKCIDSLYFCKEIIIIDDYSTDSTLKIVQDLKVESQKKNQKIKFYQRSLNRNFAKQRNFALEKTSNNWVLFVDADEYITDELAAELTQYIDNPLHGINGFFIQRKNYMWGKEMRYGEMGSDFLLRFARKDKGLWKRKVHEYWDIKGNKKRLKNCIVHNPHGNLSEFLNTIKYFSKLHAQANRKEGKKSSIFKIIFWPLGKFLYNFIYRKGFLDGIEGLIVALVMSFNSYLAWSSLWLYQKRNLK